MLPEVPPPPSLPLVSFPVKVCFHLLPDCFVRLSSSRAIPQLSYLSEVQELSVTVFSTSQLSVKWPSGPTVVSGLSALVLGRLACGGLFNNMCCEDKDYKPEEMEHFMSLFIKTSTNPASFINTNRTMSNPRNPHTHRPSKRLSSTLKDRKEGTELGDLWVSFSRGLGRALVHIWEGRRQGRQINRTVPLSFWYIVGAALHAGPEPSARARRARRAAGMARGPSEGPQHPKGKR